MGPDCRCVCGFERVQKTSEQAICALWPLCARVHRPVGADCTAARPPPRAATRCVGQGLGRLHAEMPPVLSVYNPSLDFLNSTLSTTCIPCKGCLLFCHQPRPLWDPLLGTSNQHPSNRQNQHPSNHQNQHLSNHQNHHTSMLGARLCNNTFLFGPRAHTTHAKAISKLLLFLTISLISWI